jgi:NodT family efflux transporter outer membrane factor (OMF) lipoprotein
MLPVRRPPEALRPALPHGSRRLVYGFLLIAALLNGGCSLNDWVHNGFKVGPNYATPPDPVAPTWIDYADPRVCSDPVDLTHWWRLFGDPLLDSLEDSAVAQNLTLQAAGERIMQARAGRGIAVGLLFPQTQQATADYYNYKQSRKTVGSDEYDVKQYYSQWDGGLNASWELDFWGRFRRGIEGADAQLDAAVADYDDVLVLLLAEVADSYFRYRIAQERLDYVRRNVTIQEGSLKIAESRFEKGAGTELDVQQARSSVERTRALIQPLEIERRRAANSLCVLLGIRLQDLECKLGPGAIPDVQPQVAVGMPCDLVRRRPDVRRAEREAAAASAAIGIAVSELYPHFFINGNIGASAEFFRHWFDLPASMTGQIGPSFCWNILAYGRLKNNIRREEARFGELVLLYQQQVLQANREVEDALVGFLRTQLQVRNLTASVTAAQRSVTIAQTQYRLGAVDYNRVFDLEGFLLQQQDQLAIARGGIVLSLIDIYRTLGGGWDDHCQSPGVLPPAALPGKPAQPLEQAPPPRPVPPPADAKPDA